LDADLTLGTAEELRQLVEGERAAVFGSYDRMTGAQCGFGEVEVQHHPGAGGCRVERWRHHHR
jgi:hypothetical protein